MKLIPLSLISLLSSLSATPLPMQQLTSADGRKITASVISLEQENVSILTKNKKSFTLPLSKFSDEDQALITKHFENVEKNAEAERKKSAAERTKALEFLNPSHWGKVSGPHTTEEGSNYYLYTPSSVSNSKHKRPILYYSHSMGGNPNLLKKLKEGAEIFGWVMAISKESKNKSPVVNNISYCKQVVTILLQEHQGDKDRIHYTGNSGGGAMTFHNTSAYKAFGVMPNVGYIPGSSKPRSTVAYCIGGASDYNRYYTANAAKSFGKYGFHRMSDAGHGGVATPERIDGMLWMHTQYLKKHKSSTANAEEVEKRILIWLEKLATEQPKRAYANATIFQKVVSKSGANQLDDIINKLEKSPENPLYYEGLLDLDELSDTALSLITTGSAMNHKHGPTAASAQKLMSKYSSVPEISALLTRLTQRTVK